LRFGFHVSIAGGFSRVRERAEKLGCETIQLFCSNPRGWAVAELDREDVARFRKDIRESDVSPVFVHAPYLPNLAATRPDYADRTVAALVQQLERCRALGIEYLICHVGRAMGASEDEALGQVARQVNRVLGGAWDTIRARKPEGQSPPRRNAAQSGTVPGFRGHVPRCKILLENTAGMGTEVGYRFGQMAAIINRVEQRDRVGVVLDTAHAFEAGYDLRTRAGLDAALREFDRTVGLGRLHLVHLNDSKTELGSRVDRHWHIGKGRIGREGMRVIVNHPLLRGLPAVMETPRKTDNDDRRNMRMVRSLVA